jgi:NCAIR mutase (PurE)-related protein
MEIKFLKKILKDFKDGKLSIEETLEKLKILPYFDMEFAKVDLHRPIRCGFAEVIYSPNKSISQIKEIAKKLSSYNSLVLITKCEKNIYEELKKEIENIKYYESAKIVAIGKGKKIRKENSVSVITAGTADIPIAEESAVTATLLGCYVTRLYDVGVAGVHRLIDNFESLKKAKVIIVVAGMEGALASVVGGLVDKPVIAVPTSVGYGANFKGISALLTMLNSCSPNVAVVNIDNGFGAGYLSSIILRRGKNY